MSDSNEIGVKFTGNIDGLKEAVNFAQAEVKRSTDAMRAHFESVVGIVQKVQAGFVALAAVVAGGSFLHGAVESSKAFVGEATKMGRLLGTNASEAANYIEAVKRVGGTTELAEKQISVLTRTLYNSPERFEQLGIAVRDADGNFRPMKDILLDVNDKFSKMTDGTGKNIAMTAILGRQWSEFGGVMKASRTEIAAAEEHAESLGLTVTKQSQGAVMEYKRSVAGVNSVLEGMQKAIGDAVMPVLTKLGQWFAEIGPLAVTIIKGAVGGLTAIFWGLRMSIVIVWETINAMVVSVTEPILALAKALWNILHGDFEAAADNLRAMPKNIAQAWSTAGDEILKTAEDTQTKLYNLFGRGDKLTPKIGTDPPPDMTKPKNVPKEHVEKEQDTRLAEWKDTLQEMHLSEKDFFKSSLESDLAFWQQKLALVTGSTKEDLALRRHLRTEIYAIEKSMEIERRILATESAEHSKNMGIERINQERTAAQQSVGLARSTELERVRLEIDFENRAFAIGLQRLQDEAKLHESEKAAYKKLLDEIEQLKLQHAGRVAKISGDILIQEKKAVDSWLAPIQDSIDNAFKSLLSGTLNMQKVLTSLFQAIAGSFYNALIKPMIERWLQGEAMKLAASSTFFAKLLGLQSAESISAGAAKKAEAAAVIPSEAGIAAGAAAGSVAGIPIVGPELASAAYASTYAMVMGGMAGMAGFAVGSWNVPDDMFTKVHKGESIVPAQFAEKFREGGSGAGGGDLKVNITAMPMKGGFFMLHRDELVSALKSARRDFAY